MDEVMAQFYALAWLAIAATVAIAYAAWLASAKESLAKKGADRAMKRLDAVTRRRA